eukprot:8850808-Heterocapsa_arctica.AAC.1
MPIQAGDAAQFSASQLTNGAQHLLRYGLQEEAIVVVQQIGDEGASPDMVRQGDEVGLVGCK